MSLAGRDIILSARVGAHNYNLDDADSDEDWKHLVLPNFDDLYLKRAFAAAKTSPACDYTAHDLRRFAELVRKGNPYFLEVLFSRQWRIHDRHKAFGQALLDRRDGLAAMNRAGLYRNCLGTAKEKMRTLRKGTEKTLPLVRRYGYDTKEALHAFRLLDLLARYADSGWDFGAALWYDGPSRQQMLAIKKGSVDNNRIDAVLTEKIKEAEGLASCYHGAPFDAELAAWLETAVRHEVRLALAEELRALGESVLSKQ
ncbi:hypothetical protein HM1_0723 [Heliomicrobium modesticaldum Ice1]|uniref:Nucleotidyltransferase n=1 Tax=Heliobacterium modesticaldum (strain ATCC 51547 / Ice1) TaxID=498761 RepID=B0TBA5_HELMI|nr:nucleotidyltransferase domain-containing protein [Heliomicrobium modesticaldum]ABZ83832.1 hypothetical protein HM1_0723 [Heliomicrobium modesticaldum Ice1]